MFFKWQDFCDRYGVSYVTKGPNTARNHISIHCPMCGAADTGEHMGLSLDPRRPAWGCWRNRAHRGIAPQRLIQVLLGCSSQNADSIVRQGSLPELDEFEKLLRKEPPPLEKAPEERTLRLPREFKILNSTGYAKRYEAYLEGRGFDSVRHVAKTYDLRYCLTGSFKNRLIIPIYRDPAEPESLLGWTGRDVTGKAFLRYQTLSDLPETAKEQGYKPALLNIKKTVMCEDVVLAGNEGLVIVEGPLDYIKMDYYSLDPNITVTCLFGKPTNDQARILIRAAKRYDWIALVLDPDAWSDTMVFSEELRTLSRKPVRSLSTEGLAEDPGALSADQVVQMIDRCKHLLRSKSAAYWG